MKQFFETGDIVNKVIIAILYLGQLLPQEPNPGLVLPRILLFQLGPQVLGVTILGVELAMGTIQESAQHTPGLTGLLLPQRFGLTGLTGAL